MKRIFAVIASLAVVLIFSVGITNFWQFYTQADTIRENAAKHIARGLAMSISAIVSQLDRNLEIAVKDEELIDLLVYGDEEQLREKASQLEHQIPGAMKVRLLKRDEIIMDETQVPYMGYGDLVMARGALTKRQKPMVQGEKQEHRHLGIARKIENGGEVYGVVLVSVPIDFLSKLVSSFHLEDHYFELKQGLMVLGTTGNQALQSDGNGGSIQVPDSKWVIDFWFPSAIARGTASSQLFIIGIPTILILLISFFGYKQLSSKLQKDQNSVVKLVQDLMTGSASGNYPVKLDEMKGVIATLIQYKRIVEKDLEEQSISIENQDNEKNFNFEVEKNRFLQGAKLEQFKEKKVAKPNPKKEEAKENI